MFDSWGNGIKQQGGSADLLASHHVNGHLKRSVQSLEFQRYVGDLNAAELYDGIILGVCYKLATIR